MSSKIIYATNNDEWHGTSDDEDERADTDDMSICMSVEDENLEAVSKFKKLIVKEPEFSGINQVSDYQILQAFLNPVDIKNVYFLTRFQLELIHDLHYELCSCYARKEIYQMIGNNIYTFLYI